LIPSCHARKSNRRKPASPDCAIARHLLSVRCPRRGDAPSGDGRGERHSGAPDDPDESGSPQSPGQRSPAPMQRSCGFRRKSRLPIVRGGLNRKVEPVGDPQGCRRAKLTALGSTDPTPATTNRGRNLFGTVPGERWRAGRKRLSASSRIASLPPIPFRVMATRPDQAPSRTRPMRPGSRPCTQAAGWRLENVPSPRFTGKPRFTGNSCATKPSPRAKGPWEATLRRKRGTLIACPLKFANRSLAARYFPLTGLASRDGACPGPWDSRHRQGSPLHVYGP
jgi:hypothetical protein